MSQVPSRGPGRLPLVDSDSPDPALAAVFDRFRDAGREVPNLYRTLGNSPAMLEAWTSMAWPLRLQATTSRGHRELVIMRVAQLSRAAYEWIAHRPMAIHEGVTDEQLAELSNWRDSSLFDDEQRELLTMTDELTVECDVSDETWQALESRYQPGEIIELVLTAAYYACVSRTLRALRLPYDNEDPKLAGY